MPNITIEQQTLLNLLANNLFGYMNELPENIDFEKLLKESNLQAVTAIAVKNIHLPEQLKSDSLFLRLTVNSQVFSHHMMLHEILTKAKIPYTVLKGAASAHYYPEPLFRTMGDVDFFVKKQDIPKAAEVLKQHGFQSFEENHICHIIFRKGNIHLEMHFEPAGVPNGKAGDIVREYLENIVERSVSVKNELCTFMNPDKFHHGLVMLLHMQHHLLSEGIGLRHLCDWAVFVNSFENNDFKKLFKEKLQNIGLWEFTKIISLTAHVGIGLPYQEFMGKNTVLAKELLTDILSGGNFGNKDSNRVNEGIFISTRGKNGVARSRPVQMILSLNQIIYANWPIAKKIKLFLPCFWIVAIVRRLYRECTGKRKKTKLKTVYTNSKNRKTLYQQLHLFEIE